MSERKLINVLNGKWGHLWINGVEVFAVENFNLELKLTLEKITGNGSWDTAYKVIDIEASGKFKVQYVDSMGLKDMVDTIKARKTPTLSMQESIKDEDALDGQIESVYIGEAWLENLVVADWEKGKIINKEFSFKANPQSINVLSEILADNGIKLAA